ncbi:MAG: transposase [Pseudomonadota bacterium]
MARLPRLIVPSQPHYLVQRGLNQQAVFLDEQDHTAFLGWLRAAAKTFKVALHAYVLLPAELQLLVSPADETGLGQMMQSIGRHYVPYFNGKYNRSGTLWQGRYKTALIEAAPYCMLCSRYIEAAPVRAGLVGAAADYPWSSYAHHVGERSDPVVLDHALYWALGNTPFQREAAYLSLSEQALSLTELVALEKTVLKGWPLASEPFKQALQQKLKRQVLPAKRGRPYKVPAKPTTS